MSLIQSFRFHDLNKLPDNMIDFFMSMLLAELIRRLTSRYIVTKQVSFRKNLGWLMIGCHLISLVIISILGNGFSKVRLSPLEKLCDKTEPRIIYSGLKTFFKTEPELAMKVSEAVMRLNDDYKIYKMTGIKTKFLQKYLPSLV